MIDTTETLRPWRDRLIALRSEKPQLARFVTNALRSADEQDLLLYPAQMLQELLATTFSHIGQRTPGKADIRIWTPDA
ncbi:MAG: hypothetical protein RIC93_08675, partial [Alphaproteobacteria bacterium]